MKKFLVCLFIILVGNFSSVDAQTVFDLSPPGINYQMVVRDQNGDPIANSAIILTITFKNSSNNSVLYSENHAINTDEFGLVNVVLGQGNPIAPYSANTFNSMDWSTFPVSMDVHLNSGGNFFLGNFELQSVPYSFFSEGAKHADESDFATSAGTVTMGMNALTDVTLTNPQNNQVLTYTGGQWINTAPFWIQSTPGVMLNSSSYNTRVAITNTANQSHNPTGIFSVNQESPSTNSVQEVMSITSYTTGTPAAGLGAGLSFYAKSGVGSLGRQVQLSSMFENSQTTASSFQVSLRASDGNTNPQLKLTSTGQMSIGTANPTANLHVHGNNFGIAEFRITNDYTGPNSSGVSMLLNDNYFSILNYQTGSFKLGTNNNPQIFMQPSGFVGIGIESPSAHLHLSTDSGVPIFQISDPNTGSGINDGLKMYLNDGEAYLLNFENKDMNLGTNLLDNQIVLKSSGQIGMNTASPQSTLHLHNDEYSGTLRITSQSTGTTLTDGLIFSVSNGSTNINNLDGGFFTIGNGQNTNQLGLGANGGVAVGSALPTLSKFEVIGKIGATTAIFHDYTTASAGISLITDWPGIGFNTYYNAGFKSMANNGYAAHITGDQTNGGLIFGVSLSSISSANTSVVVDERMRLNKEGNLGIGLSTFSDKLHLHNNGGFTTLRLTDNSSGTTTADGGFMRYSTVNGLETGTSDDTPVYLYQGGETALTISTDKNIGINSTTPSSDLTIGQTALVSAGGGFKLTDPANTASNWSHGYGSGSDYDVYYNGALKAYINDQSGAWVQVSDRSMKKDVTYFNGAVLEKVALLRPASYHYIDNDATDDKSVGFIAQEVEEVFPELVYDKDGMKTLNYADFGVISIAAVQELNLKVEQQADEIEALKKELELIKSLILEGKK